MTKSLKDVFNIIIDELENNTALNSWVAENFGEGSLSVQIGIDEEDPPEITNKLSVFIVPGSISRTRQFAYRSYGLTLKNFVKIPSANTELIDSLGNIDTFSSFIEEAVITRLNKESVVVTPLEGEPIMVQYPFAAAELAFFNRNSIAITNHIKNKELNNAII